MIRPVLLFVLTAFAAGGLGMYAANLRVSAPERRKRWTKFISYVVIVYSVLLSAAAGPRVFTTMMALVVVLGGYELHRLGVAAPGIWIGYLLLGAGLIEFARSSTSAETMYVYLVVAFFDGFSQMFGQLFGTRPIAARISPTKTVEGAAGGLGAAALAGVALRGLAGLSVPYALVFCAGIVSAAFAGDLAASWIKRERGVKDFGSLFPGHGGILDRFDSLLAAGPMFLVLKHFSG